MSQPPPDPKRKPPPPPPPPSQGKAAPEVEPTAQLLAPSHRSLGEDPTSLVNVTVPPSGTSSTDNSATGMVIIPDMQVTDPSDTALVASPELSAALAAAGSETSLVALPDPSDVSHTALTPSALVPVPHDTERTAPSFEAKTLPMVAGLPRPPLIPPPPAPPPPVRKGLGDEATAVLDAKVGEATAVLHAKGPEATAVLQRGPNEPSLGAKVTSPNATVAGDETAIRQVFAIFGDAPGGKRRRSSEGIAVSEGRGTLSSPRVWIGLLSALLVGGVGFGLYTWHAQRTRQQSLVEEARQGVSDAHRRGSLSDFVAAESRLRALLADQPSDGAALSARALVLAEALYELGGPGASPAATARPDGGTVRDGGAERDGEAGDGWASEVQSAARQSEGEVRPSAIAAQAFAALARADLKGAEAQLARLATLPAGEPAGGPELAALPGGMRDYLASQLALLAGRTGESIDTLRAAIGKNPLPRWQERLAYELMSEGRDAEAQPYLVDIEKHQPELCGAKIDLAALKARAATGSQVRPALDAVRGYIERPRLGTDPCGRGERARAALFAAELVLQNEPTARGEVRALLERAQQLAPAEDVIMADALAGLYLRVGDAGRAEALSRATLERLPTRRQTRLLLTRALIGRGQGSEALSVLEPLTGPPEAGKPSVQGDIEAHLLRAQALLSLNDTLEAQRLGRRILATSGIPAVVRSSGQLLLARVYLQLGEPAAARRALEPLMKKVESADGAATPDQQLDAQLLWAQALLLARPPEQSEARALLEAVAGRAPERVEARVMLGRLLRELGEWGQAEGQLSAALRTDERYTPARRELAALLLQRGDFAKAHALYRGLVKDEQDAELLLSASRAERLDGAAEQALSTLAGIKRGRGEVTTKYDEALLVERGRALLALDRPGEAEALLRGPGTDIPALRRPTVTALLLRSMLGAVTAPGAGPVVTAARALFDRTPPAWHSDADLRLAEAELLIAEDKGAAARPVLESLIAALATVPPSSVGEEVGLRQRAEKLVAPLPPAPEPPPEPAAKAKGKRR